MLIDSAIKTKIAAPSKGDSNLKSLLKTISWRIVGTIDTMIISYIVTGEFSSAVGIASIEVVSKMILYYFHERAWASVKVKK